MRACSLFPSPQAPSVSLAEATETCVNLLIAEGRASAPVEELRREVELHLWMRQLCDARPAPHVKQVWKSRPRPAHPFKFPGASATGGGALQESVR